MTDRTDTTADALQRYSARHATGHTGQLYPDPDGMWVLIDDVRAMMGQAQFTADAQAGPLTEREQFDLIFGHESPLWAAAIWTGWQARAALTRAAVKESPPEPRHCTDCGEVVTMFCRAPVPFDCKLFPPRAAPESPTTAAPLVQGALPSLPEPLTEREQFEAWLKAAPEWAPEFEVHRAWVERFAFFAWQARAALAAAAPPQQPAPLAQEPVAWVRVRPDGSVSREIILNELIEDLRKKSGAWKPLVIATMQAKDQA